MSELECRESKAGLEVVEKSTGAQLMKLVPTTSPARDTRRVVTSSVAAVGALAQSFSAVGAVLSSAGATGQGLQVVFSPTTQAAIATGGLKLMEAAKGQLPLAVDHMGRVREIGRVVPAAGLAGPALVPVLLPAAAAAAASYYQHQALQATLDEIREVVERIEGRQRDDDWAILEVGDTLAHSLVDGEAGWEVPDQLRIELAIARQQVERVFRSRRRFVNQLVSRIDEDSAGRSDPWTDHIKRMIKGEHNWIEVSMYLEAMVVRARLTACTAFVLAADGDARASAGLARSVTEELEGSYNPLLKALTPLAGHRPDSGGLMNMLPGRKASDDERFRFVGNLVRSMEDGVGQVLRSLEEETAVTVPAHEVKALELSLVAG